MRNKKSTEPSPKQNQRISAAIALHQSGQLALAETHYRKLLAVLPSHPLLLANLGIVALQMGKLEDSVKLIKRSLHIQPNQPYAFNNLGNSLKDLNRLEDALDSYDQALALKADYAEAYGNRGLALQGLYRLDEALASYDSAIALKPYVPEVYCNRGLALQHLKRLDEALESYERAITLKPDYAIAYYNHGVTLQDLNRLDEALESYDHALAIKPDYAKAYSNRGVVLQDLKRFDEALASYDHALVHHADSAQVYSNRGITLQELNRPDEALASYDHAIILRPDDAKAYYNRGLTLKHLNRLDEAIDSYAMAIVLKPDYTEAYYNRGISLQNLNRLDAAQHCYECAIVLQADHAEAYWNIALLNIIRGDYEEGWKQYEWRWKVKSNHSIRTFAQPLWLGESSLSNKTLLIYPEQGLGDYIQCLRYVSLAEQNGAKVVLEAPEALMALASSLAGQFTLIETGQPLPDFDYHCPVMSLPLAFKTTLASIPATLPYLYAEKAKKQCWHEKLGKKTALRIGLAWSGSALHKNDHKRSLLFTQCARLLELPVEFHALQKELKAIDVKVLCDFPQIHQHHDELHDFSDTAALIDEMDIIISVDTSIAHLAGAMAKELCLLLPYAPDYRWMLDRTDSLWYPTATLFRQPAMDDWDSVMTELVAFLEEIIARK